jgi:hypothetical protein
MSGTQNTRHGGQLRALSTLLEAPWRTLCTPAVRTPIVIPCHAWNPIPPIPCSGAFYSLLAYPILSYPILA